MKYKKLLLLLFVLVTIFAQSQDRHYWYQQFGGRSSMLGGAVVGDVRDNSSIFYNPAALGFIENNTLSISATVYSLAHFKIKDAFGDGIDVKKTPFLIYPQLIGGFIPFTKNQKWKWSYSLLTRNSSRFTLFSRYVNTKDILKNIEGDEIFIAGHEVESTKQEQWGGLSVGRKINENLAFGASMFIAHKRIHGFERAFYTALPQKDTVEDIHGNKRSFYISKISENRFYNIPVISIIWKLGIAAEYGDWRLGLAFTLPAINLGFTTFGDSQREVELSNIYLDNNYLRDQFLTGYLEIGRKTKNLTTAKTPLSFAGGVSRKILKGKIFFSAEYFFGVKTHNLIDATVHESTTIPETLFKKNPNLRVAEAYKPVLNVSLALEYPILKNWNLLTSARSDFNNHKDIEVTGKRPIETYYSPWDLYHFTIGGQHIGKKSNVTAGIQYSVGIGSREQYNNLTAIDDLTLKGIKKPKLKNMHYQYHGFVLNITYTYKFKNK